MQIHKHWQGLDPSARGASVAMGNFDGVHIGHQSVIAQAQALGPLGIITFEPHPREYFAPQAPAFRLMNAEARANRLAKLGLQHLYELPFDAEMAGRFHGMIRTPMMPVMMPPVRKLIRFGQALEKS